MSVPPSLRTLLHEIVDYAGLFPPAQLDMAAAVAEYAEHRQGADAWALGRFVVPVSRLAEFEATAAAHLPPRPDGLPWRLSVLAGGDLAADVRATGEFSCHHAADGAGAAVADAIEIKTATPEAIEAARPLVPAWLTAYFEIPAEPDPEPAIAAVARVGARAKVRSGSVRAEEFPSADALLRFIAACVVHRVPFKATAGLHHPVRGRYRLTYAPDSASAPMFGYLNLFLTAAFLRAGLDRDAALALLTETDPSTLHFDTDGASWRGHRVSHAQLAEARGATAIAFGSCSFREPLDDLRALRLL